jgi:hypothetical protein
MKMEICEPVSEAYQSSPSYNDADSTGTRNTVRLNGTTLVMIFTR